MSDNNTNYSKIAAREKYDEARYFLGKMRESRGKREFGFNLNAFLAAARSTTLLLQKQFRNNEVFEDWYTRKQSEMESDEIFQFIKENRDYVLHEGIVKGTHTVRIKNPGDRGIPTEVMIDGVSEETFVASASATVTTERTYPPDSAISHGDYEIRYPETGYEVETEHRYYFLDIPGEMDVPEQIKDKPVVEVCSEYLTKLGNILDEWEDHLSG